MTACEGFCVGCNEKVDVASGAAACPCCGGPIARLSEAGGPERERAALRNAPWRQGPGPETVAGAPRPVAAADDLVGRRLGHYEVRALAGRGGMGRVYLAHHLALERPCALKVLEPELVARDTEWVERFYSEARSAATLVHPNVVTVHNVGHTASVHWIEMEFVRGSSLRRVLEREGRIDPVRAVRWSLEVADALTCAHERGLVHRDVKPANVLIADDGRALLADFGLAKRVVAGVVNLPASELAGTPHFMAPELFDGAAAGPRSDVYALGVMLYQLLEGRPPFAGPGLAELVESHRREAPPPLRLDDAGIAEGAFRILASCLAKDPADRHPDAVTVRDELATLLGGLEPLDERVRQALEPLGIEARGDGAGRELVLTLAGGRSQRVRIEESDEPRLADRRVTIYSLCAPAEDRWFRRALELNAHIPHAHVAVKPVDGTPWFVVLDVYPRGTCDAEEIRRSVVDVARWADHVEAELTGEDRH